MSAERRNAVIGRDLVLHGELRNGGEVEVLGCVVGSVAADRVVIHPGGQIRGTLDAGNVEVNGYLDGKVRVRQLISIGAGGAVHGDVRYGQLALAPGGDLATEVRNVPPEIGGDFELLVRRGRSVRLTAEDLSARDDEDADDGLLYRVSGIEGGHLARTAAPGTQIESFAQGEIAAGAVVFVHDGSGTAEAGFDVVVEDSAGATSGAPRRVKVMVIA